MKFIYFVFFDFYTHFVFAHCSGEVLPGFPVYLFFRHLFNFFWKFAQGSADTVHFPGDFLAVELGEM